MTENRYELGMVGLGTMGRNLLLNMADHGFSVAGLDKDPSKVQLLESEGAGKDVKGTTDSNAFIAMLRRPRAIMMLVPAGAPVDSVIAQLWPTLEPGDILIDGGNSYFKDTEKRSRWLAEQGLEFIGVGVSGGESGARHGPSMMAGGTVEAWERVQPVLEAVAAKFDGEPCVARVGNGAAGHYVKMVHNGIEYAVMQLIAEMYDLLHRGFELENDQIAGVLEGWNRGPLNSFLIEIAAVVVREKDSPGNLGLVDLILDKAKQKGTGKWASQDAMDIGVPIPTIDAAVAARILSGYKEIRTQAAEAWPNLARTQNLDSISAQSDGWWAKGLELAILISYAQGMDLLRVASTEYNFEIHPITVAKIWRAGCIIRSALLADIARAYEAEPEIQNLLLSKVIQQRFGTYRSSLANLVMSATSLGIPVPACASALAYLDGFTSERLPANLIQGMRDYFGAHTYERVDREGTFHTHWGEQ